MIEKLQDLANYQLPLSLRGGSGCLRRCCFLQLTAASSSTAWMAASKSLLPSLLASISGEWNAYQRGQDHFSLSQDRRMTQEENETVQWCQYLAPMLLEKDILKGLKRYWSWSYIHVHFTFMIKPFSSKKIKQVWLTVPVLYTSTTCTQAKIWEAES